MQLGLCLNMVARDARRLGLDRIEGACRAGFDYVEISAMNVMELDDGAFMEDVARPMRDAALPCRAMNAFSAPTLPFFGEGARAGALDYARRLFARAAELGAGVVVLGSGVSRSRPVGYPADSARRDLVALFGEMGETARESGVTLALESLNRGETNMFCTVDEAAGAAREARIGALADYYHFTLGGEKPESLRENAGVLAHAHFARTLQRVLPVDADEDAGYLPFLRALRAGGYKGDLSVEANCPGDFYETARACAGLLKRLCAEAGF